MVPHGSGSDSSHDAASSEAARAVAGSFGGTSIPGSGRAVGRRSRAGAGGRLRDLLQQEAKDLRVSGIDVKTCNTGCHPCCTD